MSRSSLDVVPERVAITFGIGHGTLAIHSEAGESSLPVGYATWLKGSANLRGTGDEPVAACGAWTTDDTFEVRICSREDAYCPVFLFHYADGGDLHLAVAPNVSWGPTTTTTVTGRGAG